MKFNQKAKFLEPSATKQFKSVIKQLNQSGVSVIDFGHGDTDMSISPSLKKDLVLRLSNPSIYKYGETKGVEIIRQMIASKHHVDPNCIILNTGAKGCLNMLMQLLINPNSCLLSFGPFWNTYKIQTELAGGSIIKYDFDDHGRINFETLAEVLHTNSVETIIINNPHNPTGKVFSKVELRMLISLAQELEIQIISDEVYSEFVFGDQPHISTYAVAKEEGYEESVFVVNSFSKNYGLSGFRIGYVIANEQFIQKATQYVSHTVSNIPEILQHAAIHEMLQTKHHSQELCVYSKRHATARKILDKCTHLQDRISTGGIYFFPKVINTNITNWNNFAMDLLKEHGVAVIPGSSFGWDEYFRLSIGKADEESIKKGIMKIDSFLKLYSK